MIAIRHAWVGTSALTLNVASLPCGCPKQQAFYPSRDEGIAWDKPSVLVNKKRVQRGRNSRDHHHDHNPSHRGSFLDMGVGKGKVVLANVSLKSSFVAINTGKWMCEGGNKEISIICNPSSTIFERRF